MNDSKQHILDVALKLFLQKSFKEVTMRDIVEQTGLSKGAVYHYFESKETLFLEIVQNSFSSMMFSAFENYENKSLYDFYQDYINFRIGQRINHFKDSQHNIGSSFTENHISLLFDAIKIYPEFKNRLKVNRDREVQTWLEVVKRAREGGEIKSTMTDMQIVLIFLYTGNGLSLELIMNKTIENLKSEYLKLWDSFYESIKA